MADHPEHPRSRAQEPIGISDTSSAARSRGRVGTSIGVVIADMAPAAAAALVADVRDTLPRGTRQEFLVLDDHTSPDRRELVRAVDGVGDAMRLVPRPSGGLAVELDALAISCGSEFLLRSVGDDPPLAAVEPLMELMWSAGSDAGVALADGVPVAGDTATSFARYVGLAVPAGSSVAAGKPEDAGRDRHESASAGPRVVVVRRWVARWVFSETERALDPAEEVADRARLLGLEMVVVDANGVPLR
jgi:hypothetical protein